VFAWQKRSLFAMKKKVFMVDTRSSLWLERWRILPPSRIQV